MLLKTKHSILRLFKRIKKMSEIKINSIGNGNETKQHLLSLPNKSEKKSIQITIKH